MKNKNNTPQDGKTKNAPNNQTTKNALPMYTLEG